jgi:formate hydrogenlyase subunit 3/multisubunit Na+/H+ antiporter MnhD subunit
MGGLIKTMPWTAAAYIFCAFSVIGIPPFGGFFSKFMVIVATVQSGRIWVAAAALFAAVMTMFYLFKVFSAVFMGEAAGASGPPKEGTRSMVFVVVVLAVSFLSLGLHKRPGQHPLWKRWYIDPRPGLVVGITIPLVLAATSLAPAVAGSLVDRVAGAVAMPVEVAGQVLSLEVTVGLAFAKPGDDASSIIARGEEDVARIRSRR